MQAVETGEAREARRMRGRKMAPKRRGAEAMGARRGCGGCGACGAGRAAGRDAFSESVYGLLRPKDRMSARQLSLPSGDSMRRLCSGGAPWTTSASLDHRSTVRLPLILVPPAAAVALLQLGTDSVPSTPRLAHTSKTPRTRTHRRATAAAAAALGSRTYWKTEGPMSPPMEWTTASVPGVAGASSS